MKTSAIVALADACAVAVEWLAAGRGQKNAEWINPKAFPQTPLGPQPDGSEVSIGPMIPFASPGLGESGSPVTAPPSKIDPAILAKALEIVDALNAGSERKPGYLAQARRIAQAYQVLASPEDALPERLPPSKPE